MKQHAKLNDKSVLKNLSLNQPKLIHEATKVAQNNQNNNNAKWKMGKSSSIPESNNPVPKVLKEMKPNANVTTTTIITDSSTISIPVNSNTILSCPPAPKYKTMPSPTRTSVPTSLQLNEIFEEGEHVEGSPRPTARQFVNRNQSRSSYEQRRSKFHKNRTASCSSSDASDDDSENRKKRAHKLNTSSKPLPGRRDSHDDSSDSQEPGTGSGSTGNGTHIGTLTTVQTNSNKQESNQKSTGTNNSGGRQNAMESTIILGRRHKVSRRRTGETRLRESQSLNRITEVQEDTSHSLVITTTITALQGSGMVPKVKGLGARLLQGFSTKRSLEEKQKKEEKIQHVSRKDKVDSVKVKEEKENCDKIEKCTSKKMRLLGKYFHVHRKLCIPFPGIFARNRLYKAQSCSSLTRDKVNVSSEELQRRQRAVSVIRNSTGGGGGDGDINQNKGYKSDKRKSVPNVQISSVCHEISDICSVHLGQASKCSFC